MSSEECAAGIIDAIEKKKRTLVFTLMIKRTVFLNRLIPSIADKLTHKFGFFKMEN